MVVIHETHVMIITPIGTEECRDCWACKCHSPVIVFEQPCRQTFKID
ncbi:hypothetical protein QCN32_gp69 [Arthrobacter phage Niktson]|uniref:Uncharacterized protein n=1 Tax=Arthrobacter phage Niktson TaxID=2014347 RepID=A0A218M5R2_9CAUD|nr:hypothetical protein QCN32_gp69 [Arthrobacter phage Niktson]ASD52312.1 hypothetical protein NIKTSON_69 [Arthrobacter phage Niktson]ASD52408.1 hypothetical protein ELEPHANTMAN_69 [Arthrobacter phage ElephantMan]